LLQIGAGTGLLFILRWFWWRINPYSEITAMVVSFVVAVYSALFATGYWIYGRHTIANILTVIAAVSTYVLTKAWKRLRLAS